MRILIIFLFLCFTTTAFAGVEFRPGNGFGYFQKKEIYKKSYKKLKYKTVVPKPVKGVQHGIASYYWKPQPIACSRTRRYNPNLMVAAHKTLKCGTMVRVTNKRNGRSVVVKIDDRGPYIRGRIVDLSVAAATKIGMKKSGVVPVKLEVL